MPPPFGDEDLQSMRENTHLVYARFKDFTPHGNGGGGKLQKSSIKSHINIYEGRG
jgi:hypothetical protein